MIEHNVNIVQLVWSYDSIKVLGQFYYQICLLTGLLFDAHMYSNCNFLHQVVDIFHPLILTSLQSMISGSRKNFYAKTLQDYVAEYEIKAFGWEDRGSRAGDIPSELPLKSHWSGPDFCRCAMSRLYIV